MDELQSYAISPSHIVFLLSCQKERMSTKQRCFHWLSSKTPIVRHYCAVMVGLELVCVIKLWSNNIHFSFNLKDWSVSQCRHRYFTIWEHDEAHCPAIVDWKTGSPNDVFVKYALTHKMYDTLVEMWQEWYTEYEEQSTIFPLAYLRFEDILFHAEHVVDTVCKCVGGRRRRGPFKYLEASAKQKGTHEGANGLVSAIIRYGNPGKRLEGWTKGDWEYAKDHLDQSLMKKYGYSFPDWQ